MRNYIRLASLFGVLFLGLAASAGCRDEGPAEKTGKELDRGVEKTGDAIEDAGDKVKDATN